MSAQTATTLALSHYTDAETVTPHSVIQDRQRYDKPRGLWVSVDGPDDWAEWCAEENYGLGANRFVVTLADGANILRLTSVSEVLEFSTEYSRAGRYDGIDWARVAAEYQGIIIAPYQWSLRLDDRAHWYYSWDVASGCIWDAEAIAAVSL